MESTHETKRQIKYSQVHVTSQILWWIMSTSEGRGQQVKARSNIWRICELKGKVEEVQGLLIVGFFLSIFIDKVLLALREFVHAWGKGSSSSPCLTTNIRVRVCSYVVS